MSTAEQQGELLMASQAPALRAVPDTFVTDVGPETYFVFDVPVEEVRATTEAFVIGESCIVPWVQTAIAIKEMKKGLAEVADKEITPDRAYRFGIVQKMLNPNAGDKDTTDDTFVLHKGHYDFFAELARGKDLRGAWTERSACLDADPGIFYYSGAVGRNAAKANEERAEVALKYCRACPVQRECLDFNLATGTHKLNSGGYVVFGNKVFKISARNTNK